MHNIGKHPDEHHRMEVARREGQTKNIRWSEEEVELVARAEIVEEGARFINQAVLARFPGRSIDQIRYIRNTDRYKKALKKIKDGILNLSVLSLGGG